MPNPMKLLSGLGAASLVMSFVGCGDTSLESKLKDANALLQRAKQDIVSVTRTPPDTVIPADKKANLLQIPLELARQVAAIANDKHDRTVEAIKMLEALKTATMETEIVNVVISNPPPLLSAEPLEVQETYMQQLLVAQKKLAEIIGEQRIAGVLPGLPTPPTNTAELPLIDNKLEDQALKAEQQGRDTRADLLNIAEITFQDYAQEIGEDISDQQVLIPAPTPEVPSALTQEGIFASLLQRLAIQRAALLGTTVEEGCNEGLIDKDICNAIPTVVVPPSPPVHTVDTGTDLPNDIAAAANAVLTNVNNSSAAFIAGDIANPALSPEVILTEEVELGQILIMVNHFHSTPKTEELKAEILNAFPIVGELAAELDVPAATNPDTVFQPDLAGINLANIPATPASEPPAPPAFVNSAPEPLTIEAAIVEGELISEQYSYGILGEEIASLHEADMNVAPHVPTATEIAKVTSNLENAAIEDDNNGNPVRATLLRQIEAGYKLRTTNPPKLPIPASTPLILNPLSQQGWVAHIAQAEKNRRDQVAPQLANPPGCNLLTWDENDCPNILNGNLIPAGH